MDDSGITFGKTALRYFWRLLGAQPNRLFQTKVPVYADRKSEDVLVPDASKTTADFPTELG